MIRRGAIHWIDLGAAAGSGPAKRRPVVVVQTDHLNRSTIRTTVIASLTSNTSAALFPGNVFVPSGASGLERDSVVNVSQVMTVDQSDLGDEVGALPPYLVDDVDRGLRLVLEL